MTALPRAWGTWLEFLAPAFDCGHMGREPAKRNYLSIAQKSIKKSETKQQTKNPELHKSFGHFLLEDP